MKRAGGLPTEGNETHDLGSQKEMKVMMIITVQSQSAGELWAAILLQKRKSAAQPSRTDKFCRHAAQWQSDK